MWLVVVVAGHGGRAVYDLPGFAVALGIAAGVVAALAWVVLVVRGGWFGPVTAVLGALIVATAVTIPIVGVLLLVGAVVAMARRQQKSSDKPALAAGLVVALTIPTAGLVATDGPIVRCHADGGVSTESSVFRQSSSTSGSGSSTSASPSGFTAVGAEGHFTSGGRAYTYRCDRGRLVQFEASTVRR